MAVTFEFMLHVEVVRAMIQLSSPSSCVIGQT